MRLVPHTRIENLRLTELERGNLFGPHWLKLGPKLCALAHITPPAVVHVRILGTKVFFRATISPGLDHEVVLTGFWARHFKIGQEIHVDTLIPSLRTDLEAMQVRILETDGKNSAIRVRLGTIRDLEEADPPQ